jgi:hypothetical protein
MLLHRLTGSSRAQIAECTNGRCFDGRGQKMKRENEFNKLLAKSIDNSLREVFNENATSAIYAYLESNYGLNQEEIPQKLDLFVDGLHKFLSTGAYAVEHFILENLYSNFKCAGELDSERDFENSIMNLKTCLKLG